MYTALAPAYEEAYKTPSHRLSGICCSATSSKGAVSASREVGRHKSQLPWERVKKQTGMQKITDAVSLQPQLEHPALQLTSHSPACVQGLPGTDWPHATRE